MLQTFEEIRKQEQTDGAQRVNVERVKLNDMKSQARKLEANIRENTRNNIQSINADSGLEIQRIDDGMTATVVQMKAEAEKESAELLANTRLQVKTLIASAELKNAQSRANAELHISMAEGKIASWIEKKKAHETQMKQVEVYHNLAKNEKLILSGSTDDDVNLVAVADSILQDVDDEGINGRSKMLAEISIMSSGASELMSKPGTTVM